MNTSKKVERVLQQIKMFGYQHVSPEIEEVWLNMLLSEDFDLEKYLAPESLGRYKLAAEPLRSAKNGVICLVAVVCRKAIALGADPENCYALSDYAINEVEECVSQEEVKLLAIQTIRHYAQSVTAAQRRPYPLPVSRAMRFIRRRLYEPCRLKDIAAEVKLNPSYLSTLFKQAVGVNIKAYIRKLKLEEARGLLTSGEHSVAEIAALLGYSSSSHFAWEFNKQYGRSPREFVAAVNEGEDSYVSPHGSRTQR